MLQLEKLHEKIEQCNSISVDEKIVISNVNKANQENINLLEEIFHLNDERDCLYIVKKEMNNSLREMKGMTAFLAIIACFSFIVTLVSSISFIPSILFLGFFITSLIKTIYKESENKRELEFMNIKNQILIIKIKEKVSCLKESLFFKFKKKDLDKSNAKLEKHIQLLKKELKFCNLWNMQEEVDFSHKQENWKIIAMDEQKLLNQLEKNINKKKNESFIDKKDNLKTNYEL